MAGHNPPRVPLASSLGPRLAGDADQIAAGVGFAGLRSQPEPSGPRLSGGNQAQDSAVRIQELERGLEALQKELAALRDELRSSRNDPPTENQPTENQPTENQPTENQPGESHTPEGQGNKGQRSKTTAPGDRSSGPSESDETASQDSDQGNAEGSEETDSGDLPEETYLVTYDTGWTLRPLDKNKTPFELTISTHNQFRYTGFDRTVSTFADRGGNATLIQNRNDFDINRGRLVFSGYALDPQLTYYTNIDYNTVSEQPIQLLLSWLRYEANEALNLSFGLGKVPGTWEWQQTSRYTLGAERSLATTFFRPSITSGVWVDGQVGSQLYYTVLLGDGFNTFTLRASELDTNLVFSSMVWWEPLEEFGVGFSDLEWHDRMAIRLGHALTYTKIDGTPLGEPGPEQTVIRLSDGTRVVTPGALAPGVTVNSFVLSLYTVHLGLKYRGMSFASEYFFRWLDSLRGTGPLPISTLFDQGFFVQAAVFAVPETWELFIRGSHVNGRFGDGSEVSVGVNWYVQGQRNWRVTADVARLDDSPTEQSRTGFVAGASGSLFRVQCWTFF